MNMSLKEVPDSLHGQLQARAKQNRRSLNSEILFILETALSSEKIIKEDFITKARLARQKFHGHVRETDLQMAKRAGRS